MASGPIVLCLVSQLCPTLCDLRFSRQENWSRLPSPPRDLSDPGIKPKSPTLQADSLPSESPGKPKNTGVGKLDGYESE